MKKVLIFLLGLGLIAPLATAQTTSLTSKNGHEILPQEGDYSLGMNAVPVLNFALNAINIMSDNGSGATHPGFVSGSQNSITGKYYITPTKAYRGAINFTNSVSNNYSHFDDPNDTSDEPDQLTDNEQMSSSSIYGSVGLEYRRGHNRLQGFYGAEVILGASSSKTAYKYGQEAVDQLDFNGAQREVLYKDGTQVALGGRGFVGVDYFIAPKISIGAEFGWGLGLFVQGRGKTVIERNDDDTIVEDVTRGSSNTFFLGTGIDNGGSFLFGGSGALTLNFLF
tara:strand:+ start:769 stop:1611 length:843 start_codon:yes stop_codon:yes gene_type:complete